MTATSIRAPITAGAIADDSFIGSGFDAFVDRDLAPARNPVHGAVTSPTIRPMSARVMVVVVALTAASCGGKTAEPTVAPDDAERRAATLLTSAERNFELLEMEQARADLHEAMDELRSARLSTSPLAARTHVWLAVVHASGFGDRDAARDELSRACAIDATIEIPPSHRTPDLSDLTIEARRRR